MINMAATGTIPFQNEQRWIEMLNPDAFQFYFIENKFAYYERKVDFKYI